MQIQLNKPEFVAFLQMLGFDYQSTVIQKCVTVDNAVSITKGPVKLRIDVSASDGSLILNIVQATVLGVGLFGSVRVIAGNLVLRMMAPYKSLLKSFKNAQGNISIVLTGLSVVSASCVNGTVGVVAEVLE